MPGQSLAIDIRRVSEARREGTRDSVAVEEPLEIQLASPGPAGCAAKSIAITMRTPGDDVELALGFLYGEGIIERAAQVSDTTTVGRAAPGSDRSNTVRVDLCAGVEVDLERLQRHFYTTSSCGVCGKASLDALRVSGVQTLRGVSTRFRRDVLTAMPERLKAQQDTFKQTGGLHAAAAFDRSGEIVVLREDVGRHNAVDKVVGWLLQRERLPAAELGLLVSGRASFELLQKALLAGMPLLAAVGAPSSLAVQLAQDFALTLVGFLRAEGFNIYTAADRITP
ncbi:MAG: formate dehydrogenase accessory sulfurtransferase FdhD [Gammaproteobacteria bacterium]|nr:MAG: formate dehydrogenase accessory sulfurtransferase FdhD [Gammaproteobacteria bacterium]